MNRAIPLAARHARGVTLVELIAFIVIVAVVATAMVQAFSGTMRGSHFGKQMTQATQLAQQRMEVIVGQLKYLGYANVAAANYDPCKLALWAGPPEACGTTTSPAGPFVIDSSFDDAADACGAGSGIDCRVIAITVDGPYGDRLASLTYHAWNY